MSLLEQFEESFCLMDKVKVKDGEGGFATRYVEGLIFKMPQAHDTTIEAQKAEQEGTASAYSFLPKKGMHFEFHDVFKRLSDGQIFRVTSPTDEKKTPASSSLNRTYMTAEKWRLPS